MPNTPVRAAAEGMPAINRRTALALAGAGVASLVAADATAYLLPLAGDRYAAMQPEMVLALVELMASEAQS